MCVSVCVLVIRLALGLKQVGSIQIKTKNLKISSARREMEPNLICNYYCLTRSISRHLSRLTATFSPKPTVLLLLIQEALPFLRVCKIFKYLKAFICIFRYRSTHTHVHNCCSTPRKTRLVWRVAEWFINPMTEPDQCHLILGK